MAATPNPAAAGTDASMAGKTALVVGASRGIGRAITEDLQRRGARVYGTSRNRDDAQEIAERTGTRAIVLDICDLDSIASAVSEIIAEAGRIDFLVCNAGVNKTSAAIEMTEADWDLVQDTNLKGTFFTCQAVARTWIDAGDPGSIVIVTSQAGVVAIEERVAYGTSKAGAIHLAKQLALEWAPSGIRVNTVAPTFIRTELTAPTLEREEFASELLSRIPQGRFGTADEAASAVSYLLGEGASLINGHTLVVDGGYTIR